MPIPPKDIQKLALIMREGHPHAPYRQRYLPGAVHVGVYRILALWPDKLQEVENVDGEWRENAVVFLEVNPLYFRSGYDKAQLLRRLKRADLSADHQKRLRKISLAAVESAQSVEFRQYCQLATRLASREMDVTLAGLEQSSDALIGRRAQWMRQYVTEGLKARSGRR